MMARWSALSALAAAGLPSTAAKGLDTGLAGLVWACGACARAASASAGIAGLAGAAIEPVVTIGRGVGSGILSAKAGVARHANSAAIATLERATFGAVRAVK